MPSFDSAQARKKSIFPIMTSRFLVLSFVCLALTACSGEEADTHAGQPVTKRKLVFKEILRTFEPMGLTVRGRAAYDKQQFLEQAAALEALTNKPWQYFTPDSNYSPTRAKPDIWQKPEEFKQAQQKFIKASEQLTQSAKGDNLEAIRKSYDAVEESCKSCHHDFRGPKR
ncbi:cytochrome c556 [Sulfurirhabdus autotrophica]|uniref:Cytochrome c556 n=2 Tax=Sulfurirhabdus autotrophica TaxID=1706046 RepID=A0A4R3Y224_9PROT|nr:cytochrome c556 [Sulfurirhabdus autotrophica]